MECLRTRLRERRLTLEAPVVSLLHPARGARARLVLTAHFADPAYFEGLRALPFTGTVFYERVRNVDEREAHWREKHHRLLRRIRTGFYARLAELGTLAFQEHAFPPRDDWVNADVTCCELAARLEAERVSTRQLELALGMAEMLLRPGPGAQSNFLIDRLIRGGLLFAGAGTGLELAGNRRLLNVLNRWRSQRALETVFASGADDFTLIYGAAHGEDLLAGLRARGYEECGRDWRRVLSW